MGGSTTSTPIADDRANIPDHLFLYRLIDPALASVDTLGRRVISDGAFRSDEVSVLRKDMISQQNALATKPGWGLVEIKAGDVRAAGCILVSTPTAVAPSHVSIYRADKPKKRISGSSAMRMNQAAVPLVWPTACQFLNTIAC